MMDSDRYLDKLFQKAQQDPTEMTFEEASANLLQTTLGHGDWGSYLASLKSMLMIVGVVGLGTIMWFTATPDVPLERTEALNISPVQIDPPQGNAEQTMMELPKTSKAIGMAERTEFRQGSEIPSVEEQTEALGMSTPLKLLASLSNRPVPFPTSIVDRSSALSLQASATVPLVTPVTFQINESSSTQTLARISAMAERAGIDYTYVVDLKKKLIREFNVEMFIKGTDKATSIQVNVPRGGQFEIELGWDLNEHGQAIALSREITVNRDKAKHLLTQTQARNLYRIYLSKGAGFLQRNFNQLSADFKPKRSRDRLLNMAGYYFLYEGRPDEAIEIFSLNCQLFPQKPNTWDSLGEALYRAGKKEEALQAFRKALKIRPNFPSAKRWEKQILSEK